MQNLDNLARLDLLDDEQFLQPAISKSKQYDFLPLAYHSEMIQEKFRAEFGEQKLKAQLEMGQKFQDILGKAKDCLAQWQSSKQNHFSKLENTKTGFFPEYDSIRQKVHKMQGPCQDMKRQHIQYMEQMRHLVIKKEILEELAQRLQIKEEEMLGMVHGGQDEHESKEGEGESRQEELERIQRMMYQGLDRLEEIRQIQQLIKKDCGDPGNEQSTCQLDASI